MYVELLVVAAPLDLMESGGSLIKTRFKGIPTAVHRPAV